MSFDITYKGDDSDRPETIRKKQAEIDRKTEQDKIDTNENIPNIIKSLKDPSNDYYNEKTETERDAMDWITLSEYHSQMSFKKKCILELLKIKGLGGTKAEWDTEGAKTLIQIESDIKTEKEKEE